MKLDKRLKTILIILLIILISIISFGGIYVQEKNYMVNILADYQLGMDLAGGRIITIVVCEDTEYVYYDADGNEVDEEDEDGTVEEVSINSEEDLTAENYKEAQEVIEARLKSYGITDYLVRLNEETGRLTVQIPEDSYTDMAVQFVYTTGEFEVVGDDDEELFDNSDIKSASAVYTTSTSGTTVYLNIEFNDDCVEKLQEVSNTYVTTTDDDGNETEREITMYLDGSELVTTSFDEEITSGSISISIGSTSTDTETIAEYLEEANNLAILLNNGKLPLTYDLEQNRYMKSDITTEMLITACGVATIIFVVALIVLCFIYKKNGILVAIANIGYVALLLIILRYTNVIITIEGLCGIIIAIILNYIFNVYLLKMLKEDIDNEKAAYNKTAKKMSLGLVPAAIIAITMCFVEWMPIYSFGEIIFWGILILFVYNTVVTRTLLVNSDKVKQ